MIADRWYSFSADWDKDIPIYVQLEKRIRMQIFFGLIKEGDFLPSIRDIAEQTGINAMTANKAMQRLIRSQILKPARGVGCVVVNGAVQLIEHEQREQLQNIELPKLIEIMDRLGLNLGAIR